MPWQNALPMNKMCIRDSRRVDHLHDHREVLLAHRSSVLQIQNERLQERRLRTVPEPVSYTHLDVYKRQAS